MREKLMAGLERTKKKHGLDELPARGPEAPLSKHFRTGALTP